MQMSQALQGFLLDLRARRRSPATLKWYTSRLERAITDLGNPDVNDLTAPALRGWLESLDTGAQTIHGYFRAMRAFLRWLELEGELGTGQNPMRRVKAPHAPQPIKARFTADEVRQLVAAARGVRDKAIIQVLADTGLRASELLGLRVGDVNLGEGWVMVRRGKGGKPRQVPLSDAAAQALWKWTTRRPSVGDALWATKTGTPLSGGGLRMMLRRLEKRTGIHCNPHKFRHTFATRYARRGNLFALQKVLGHTSLTVVRRYAELAFEDVQDDYKRTMS